MTVSITHNPSARTIRFDKPSDAARWLENYKAKKLNVDDLEIDSPIHLSVYTQGIPYWAAEMFARVELDYGSDDNRIVPRIHWMNKPKKYSTGTTYYQKNGVVTHIAISAGTDMLDTKGVILHELAHRMAPAGEHHGREFYRTLFTLLRRYLTLAEEEIIVGRENAYMKYSKFWYREMWYPETIVYRAAAYSAPRKTEAQKTEDALDKMFGDE